MILSTTCVIEDSSGDCKNLISLYMDNEYFLKFPDDYFDYNSILFMQKEILSHKIMKKRSIMNNIHKIIGNKNYEQIFNKKIKYNRISQTFTNDGKKYKVIQVDTVFSEAILIMCNSFKIATELNDTNAIIHFLNKTDDPFHTLIIKLLTKI